MRKTKEYAVYISKGDDKMKKFSKVFNGALTMLLVLLMLMSVITVTPLRVDAAKTDKVEKKYEIAIVFDNSGSMYKDFSKNQFIQYWCRAKYAVEIFASMLNYDNGDRLRIYPMWGVVTDGTQPTTGGSIEPVLINNKADIDKISNLFTPVPGETPFAPAQEAHDYLASVTGKEKWLIVLTDGEFNQIERGSSSGTLSANDLKNRLVALADNGIKVQYLGFGSASRLQEEPAKNFFAKTSSDTSLKDDLISICNAIFQRSILPMDRLSGTTLNLDLSMNKIIVFAQGANAKIESLTNSTGKSIGVLLDSGQRKYSNISAYGGKGQYVGTTPDTSLAGQVVTFDACKKGAYTLNYSGADAIQIFYEPDVDIQVTITNSDGAELTGPLDQIPVGDYTITSKIVDRITREDVTNHPLMGNDVSLKTKIKKEGDSSYQEYPNGSTITFTPDSVFDITVEGKYLKDYTITSDDDIDLKWLKGIKVVVPSLDLKLDATATQTTYTLSEFDGWAPIKVTLTGDGAPLTDEQLARTKLNINPMDTEYKIVPLSGQSAFEVYIGQNESGTFAEPKVGKYQINFTAEYTDEYGVKSISNGKKVTFEIRSAELTISTDVQQKGNWYLSGEQDDWEPIRVNLQLDGKKLTDDELSRIKLDIDCENLKYRLVPVSGESAIDIRIFEDENGDKLDFEEGKYKLKVSATLTDAQGGGTTSNEAKETFQIQKHSRLVKFLIIFGIILLILLLIAAWLLHPVLPKKVYVVDNQNGDLIGGGPVRVKNFTIQSKSPAQKDILSGKAKVAPKLKNSWIKSILKPTGMSFILTEIGTEYAQEITISGITYTCQNGQLFNINSEPETSIEISECKIEWREPRYYVDADLKVNKNS